MGLFHREHATIERGAEAQALRDRLAAVPLVRPCDRARVEEALAAHLRALGLESRSVRWIEAADANLAARDGFLAFGRRRTRRAGRKGRA